MESNPRFTASTQSVLRILLVKGINAFHRLFLFRRRTHLILADRISIGFVFHAGITTISAKIIGPDIDFCRIQFGLIVGVIGPEQANLFESKTGIRSAASQGGEATVQPNIVDFGQEFGGCVDTVVAGKYTAVAASLEFSVVGIQIFQVANFVQVINAKRAAFLMFLVELIGVAIPFPEIAINFPLPVFCLPFSLFLFLSVINGGR